MTVRSRSKAMLVSIGSSDDAIGLHFLQDIIFGSDDSMNEECRSVNLEKSIPMRSVVQGAP